MDTMDAASSYSRRFVRRAWRGTGLCPALFLPLLVTTSCLDRKLSEPHPRTSNTFVDKILSSRISKIDLLFVVDNSVSMADKQRMLERAVPSLLDRLINPACVLQSDPTIAKAGPGAEVECEPGFEKEFKPVDDIHIGVVSSSLGARGGNGHCSVPEKDDHGRLVGSVRSEITSYQGLGFLAWDQKREKSPPGESNSKELIASFQKMVMATGESGCGYEAPLEAWYRFLIDPEPPERIVLDPATGRSRPEGLDTLLLDQRKAFLRPDSLVAIIMLTDENDCSITDSGFGWMIDHKTYQLPRATSACDTDPNDKCCRPCGVFKEASPPEGCVPREEDPNCKISATYPKTDESQNLRCFDQKRRFGFDFLYPTSRYVEALRSTTVRDRSGKEVVNPLFADLSGGSAVPRDPALVFLAGIVGVPWQDIASPASLDGPGLRYLTATEMKSEGRWAVVLGDPERNAAPSDPLMIESIDARVGRNPITGAELVGPSSTDPRANPINGHEYLNRDPLDPQAAPADLQYACIYPLDEPRVDTSPGADCAESLAWMNRPLCNDPNGLATYGATQYYAKAYPGTRLLEVLRDFGANSIVASICPKNTALTELGTTDPSFGYSPAVTALIDRLKVVFNAKCLPRELQPDASGQVPCKVIEASEEAVCDCAARAGREPNPVTGETAQAVLKLLGCKGDACSGYCLCTIEQTPVPECLEQAHYGDAVGYCYIDAAKGIGNPSFVKSCPDTEKRMLRFVGDDTPRTNSRTFIACSGASYSEVDDGR